MRFGVLTGGGDAPGLNAAIRAVTRKALNGGHEVSGIRNGWMGLLTGESMPLNRETVRGILPQGGTILGTSRTNPYTREGGAAKVKENIQRLGLDALLPIGGDDTLSVALKLSQEGVPLVGIPKSIDNDLSGTDFCIGFDTAIDEVMRSVDRLHPTAEAHHRVMIVEVMGRNAGWIATLGGLAGGADVILAPGFPFSIDEVCSRLRARHEQGNRQFSIVVVAEGAAPTDIKGEVSQDMKTDEFGHVRLGGIGHLLAPEIESRTGYETRVTVLGHTQRGGSPSAFDRIMATRYGVAAVEQAERGNFGVMVALRGNQVVPIPLQQGVGQMRQVDTELYEIAKLFS